ncbi:macrophage mannose receptor 1-like [Sardina pilchardus]|uniref:macrophage mannose receptor 1-like n=1 Tax=Sardina pilchardus TaxID=27697 RepID=UPI002E0EFB77
MAGMTLLLVSTLLLSVPQSRQFHVVKEYKMWAEAQQYCREKFTDLATIDGMSENEVVKSLMHDAGVDLAWIGLKRGSRNKWQWSLADGDFYSQNEEFRNWASGQPVGQCVDQRLGGIWYANECSKIMPFICYDAANSTHVLLTERKNWADAQRYCRENHTDLTSVRNQAENDQIKKVRGSVLSAWVGLFSDAWEWSGGSNSSFRHWTTGEPNYGKADAWCTAITSSGQWNDEACVFSRNFICYDVAKTTIPTTTTTITTTTSRSPSTYSTRRVSTSESMSPTTDADASSSSSEPVSSTLHSLSTDRQSLGTNGTTSSATTNHTTPSHNHTTAAVKRQMVRVEVQTDSQVNMEDPAMLQAFLQQIQQRLRERGMPADAKLTWMRQPDGKVFQEKNDEK